MRQAPCGLLLGLTLLGCALSPDDPVAVADPSSHRELPLGAVVGARGVPGGQVWRGIPFAEPPVADRRWRAPLPVQPWQGTREALQNPSACAQIASPLGGRDGAESAEVTGSEDCLSLNVFTPAFEPDAVPEGDARLPVLVWIHGGGNSIGDISIYDAGRLAVQQQVVVVAVQYRLGPLGWFRHPALRTTGASDASRSGNFATLDLIESLRFVRDQVAAFGGDPGNVTIFGESAGGTNVISLLMAPAAGGLFHRAIVQSGTGQTSDPAAAENYADAATPGHVASSQEIVLSLLVNEGSAPDRAGARAFADRMDHAETARFLRSAPAEAILGAYPGAGFGMLDMPKLFADGTVLPAASTFEVFEAGDYHRVPLLLGTTRDEGKTFQVLNPDFVDLQFGILPWVEDWDRYDREAEYGAKLRKAVGVDELARRAHAVQGPTVYTYRFDWDEEPTRLFALDFSRLLGAAHGLDVFFVFGAFDLGMMGIPLFDDANEPGRVELSDQMMSYWTEFAVTGAPGQGREGGLPAWTAWDESDAASPRMMVLDTAAGGGLRMVAEGVVAEGIVQEVAADPRFPDDATRCAFLRRDRRGRVYLREADLAPVCAAVASPPPEVP